MLKLRTMIGVGSAAIACCAPSALDARPETNLDVPQACTVVTQETLKNAGATSVADALRNLPTGCTAPQNLSPFARDVLNAHNAVRYKIGSPPLQWDPVLEQHALARSQELARIHQLVHAPREGRGTERENILKAPSFYSTAQMMKVWSDEGSTFVPGVFPNICSTGGDCSGVWHYSQMAWSTTLYIGCGSTRDGTFVWLVCRYNPGGNKDGKPVGTEEASVEGYKVWNTLHLTEPAGPVAEGEASLHEDAFPSGNLIDDTFIAFGTPPNSPGFLVLNNTVDQDGNVESVTFYDPAFASGPTLFDGVADTYYLDTGSWRRGVRVGTNLSDDIGGANTLFQDIGTVDFSTLTEPSDGIKADKDDIPSLPSSLAYSSDAFTAQIAGLIGDDGPDLDWAVGGGAIISGPLDLDVAIGSTPAPTALTFMLNRMLDFGDDDGVSGFVGGGVGVARVSYNNIRAFSNQAAVIDDSDTSYVWEVLTHCRPCEAAPGADRAVRPLVDMMRLQELETDGGSPASAANAHEATATTHEDQATIEKLEASNDPLRSQLSPQDEVEKFYQKWRDEYHHFAAAAELNDQRAMRGSFDKLADITKRYYHAYWAAKHQGVDLRKAYDADDMQSDLVRLGGLIDQETKVEQPSLAPSEPFKAPEPKPGDLDPL